MESASLPKKRKQENDSKNEESSESENKRLRQENEFLKTEISKIKKRNHELNDKNSKLASQNIDFRCLLNELLCGTTFDFQGSIDLTSCYISDQVYRNDSTNLDTILQNKTRFPEEEGSSLDIENSESVNTSDLEQYYDVLNPFRQIRHAIPLHVAATAGFLECAEVLVKHGADVNSVDGHSKETVLFSLIGFKDENDKESNKIKCGLDINYDFENAKNFFNLLIENGANTNHRNHMSWTPLHMAAIDRTEMSVKLFLKLLLNNGADVNAVLENTSPEAFMDDCYIDVTHKTIGQTPLHFAVRHMLNEGFTGFPEQTKRSLSEYQQETVKILLDHGARVDIPDEFGNLFLHYAAANGSITGLFEKVEGFSEILRRFVNVGNDAGDTLMIFALHFMWDDEKFIVETVKLLHENGGDVNSENKWGFTPLLIAKLRKLEIVAQYLVDNGADLGRFKNVQISSHECVTGPCGTHMNHVVIGRGLYFLSDESGPWDAGFGIADIRNETEFHELVKNYCFKGAGTGIRKWRHWSAARNYPTEEEIHSNEIVNSSETEIEWKKVTWLFRATESEYLINLVKLSLGRFSNEYSAVYFTPGSNTGSTVGKRCTQPVFGECFENDLIEHFPALKYHLQTEDGYKFAKGGFGKVTGVGETQKSSLFPKEDECVVCMTETPKVIFVPCGHRVVCGECSSVGVFEECPMCGKNVELTF